MKREDLNKKVLIVDKRDHIAGNMYDYIDDNGIYNALKHFEVI